MRALLLASLIILLIVVIGSFCLLQRGANRDHAYQAADLTVSQVENVLQSNTRKQKTLTASLKEDYITRAKAVSYILDNTPEAVTDVGELKKIAELLSVDEIHLFDNKGVIFSGTVPKYYGYGFDSGEQIGYFKPMLNNKDRSMCQDITPNTAEQKEVMYAICWNEAGTRMTQVGIEPIRLLSELRSSKISEIVDNMPSYAGLNVFVVDRSTDKIAGATRDEFIGKALEEVGINPEGVNSEEVTHFEADVDGTPAYCSAKISGSQMIVASQSIDEANNGLLDTMALLGVALVAAGVFFVFIVRRLTKLIAIEQSNANTDPMTRFFNRRAYESTLAEDDGVLNGGNLVYVSMDLNYLKATNDTAGHAAGDKLIIGAGECMKRCFGSYGSIYRIGGDEFVALIYTDGPTLQAILKDFEEAQANWSKANGMELSISVGCVPARNCPDQTLAELAKTADASMYEAKQAHHRTHDQAGER